MLDGVSWIWSKKIDFLEFKVKFIIILFVAFISSLLINQNFGWSKIFERKNSIITQTDSKSTKIDETLLPQIWKKYGKITARKLKLKLKNPIFGEIW